MTAPLFGSAEHAQMITKDRHPSVQTALAWLAFSHLPPPLQDFSRPFYQSAVGLILRVPNDSVELTTALNTLVEAKDWAVRAGIRSDNGRPGPVPRPAEVVDPPRGPQPISLREQTIPSRDQLPEQVLPMIRRPIRDNPQA
jgi:hypothetical protein